MDTKKCKEISFLLRFLFLCPESEFFNDDVCKVEVLLPVNRTSCAKLTFSAFQQTLVVDRIPIFLVPHVVQQETLVRASSVCHGRDVFDIVEARLVDDSSLNR